MRKGSYESWKGLNGIKRAEEIERRLAEELGRKPKKKDFIENGFYGAWMTLYRYRKKTPGLEEIYTLKIRKLIASTTDEKLLRKILEDIIQTIGQDKAASILNRIRRTRGWSL